MSTPNQLPDDPPQLLTVPQVAHRLNVPASWVYAKAEAGELAHLKLGRYVRFEPRAIEEFLLAHGGKR